MHNKRWEDRGCILHVKASGGGWSHAVRGEGHFNSRRNPLMPLYASVLTLLLTRFSALCN